MPAKRAQWTKLLHWLFERKLRAEGIEQSALIGTDLWRAAFHSRRVLEDVIEEVKSLAR